MEPREFSELKLPEGLRPFNNFVLDLMAWLNGLAHLVLGLALGAAVLLFTWLFVLDIWTAVGADNLAQGFLHGLGTLMLLWTVSALITAEIRYMRGHKLSVDTFVEVAIVVLVRKLITMPVQSTLPSPQDFLLWVAAAVLLGLMYLVVRYAQNMEPPESHPSQADDMLRNRQ
ncbi:uncharacterized membrane protein (DUF373 family) [Rhodoblastus acidophilus]|uniref:phosphate-starvation-inducible PsiE family protein n=1 Tax=Rhodoblastus acidophilus TaxID=1074 RepID=UPI00222575FF|nr:phosphate-starvation-inducible PsiE family protein [Rhodoblastus acidophilus]MCW2283679.1 uncharacterized membrane protein (DUF373 family) [Rhodoblastus acidophilus]MCW2332972.1 uncharacterized membrane protein (DUF373 family) [Rhodoblastus acidophilus]